MIVTRGLGKPPIGNIAAGGLGRRGAAIIPGVKVWTGVLWRTVPVKVWNGLAWITRPVRTWDGASWS